MSSCHNEALAVVCANDHLEIQDPRDLFTKCLDPPDDEVIDDAIDYLVQIQACQRRSSAPEIMMFGIHRYSDNAAGEKISPTDFGSLLSTLAMGVDEARVVLEGGRLGLLHETLAFMAILKHKPSPIVHFFGDAHKNQMALAQYYPEVEANSKVSEALAHLSAYIHWDIVWNRKHNQQNGEAFRRISTRQFHSNVMGDLASKDTWKWTAQVEDEHITWCKAHNVNPTSMRSITELVETTMNVLFLSRNEPEWLRCADPTPIWKRKVDLNGDDDLGFDMLPLVYGRSAPALCNVLKKLASSQSALESLPFAQKFLDIPTSVCRVIPNRSAKDDRPLACVHFLQGSCKWGNRCRNSHSPSARRPPCRYHASGTCTKGSKCVYSHENENIASQRRPSGKASNNPNKPLVPMHDKLELPGGALGWYLLRCKNGNLFMLGEGGFEFTRALESLGLRPAFTSTNVPSPSSRLAPQSLINVDATALHLDTRVLSALPRTHHFAWNFPFTGSEEDSAENELLLLQTFQSIALLGQATGARSLEFAIGLQGDQFSRWNVLRSSWRTGWFLSSWCDFDHNDFPSYHPRRQNGETFPVDKARFYAFKWTCEAVSLSH